MIYLDNAATSFPKPEPVYRASESFIRTQLANPGRGTHSLAQASAAAIERTRRLLAKLLGVSEPRRIAFNSGATAGLNTVLHGLLQAGDAVWISALEHNAVCRPLHVCQRRGVQVAQLPHDPLGRVLPGVLQQRLADLRPEARPRLLVVNQASNVSGLAQPLGDIAALAARYQVPLLIDTAQAAGCLPLGFNPSEVPCCIVLTGHKGLFGLPGCGALYVHPALRIRPLLQGGTGAHSGVPAMPEELPAGLEAGTLNVPGIHALGEGLRWLFGEGLEKVHKHEQALLLELLDGLARIPRVRVLGREDAGGAPLVSLQLEGMAACELAALLDSLGIAARAGLHCAPDAHRLLGSYPHGSLRLSLSALNKIEEVRTAVGALEEIASSL